MAMMTPLGLLVMLLLGTTAASDQVCVSGRKVALSLDYITNATGHPKVNAHLQQPLESPGWELDFEMGDSANGAVVAQQRKTLTLTLSGPQKAKLTPKPTPVPTPAPTPKPAPPGYVTLPGLGHYRASTVESDWQAARNTCQREGADLAIPASLREINELLARFTINAPHFWVGATDVANEGKFVTIHGVPLEKTGYSQFHPGQPSGGRTENCLALIKSTKQYADGNCIWKHYYICKAPL